MSTAVDDAPVTVTVIEPERGWRMLDLKELWAYRELLWVLASRDVRVRYKQTVLGAAWAMLRPFVMMIVFSVIFGRLAKVPSEGVPYPIFVYSGLLPWMLFSTAVTSAGSSVVGSSSLISKVYFPRLVIPLASIGSALVDFAISTLILFALMLWFGTGWTPRLLAAPVLVAAVVFTALGVGTLLSAVTVAYRDFTHLAGFLVQIWLYVTPVIYPVTMVPEHWRWVLFLNPMAGLVDAFRAAFLGRPFDLGGIAISFLISVAVFVAGIAYFERVERRFADII